MPVRLGTAYDLSSTKLWSRRSLGIAAGFFLLLVLLIANAFVVHRELDILVENQAWIDHTGDVLLELERTEALLTDAETGQRGYLYTGDTAYLVPYNDAVSQIDPHIDAVARLTADNPRQQQRVRDLRRLAHAKFDVLSRTIALYRSGRFDDAKTLVTSGEGLTLMRSIRTQIGQMRQEENSLDASRSARYRRSVSWTTASIYLASSIAVVGLVFLAYWIVLDLKHRARAATDIHSREAWYRVTLTGIGDAVIATDEHGIVTFLNPVAEELTGFSMAQAAGKDIATVFPIFNELTNQTAPNPVAKVIQMGCVVALANHTVLKRLDGAVIPIEDSAAPIRDDRGHLIGVVLVFHDVTKVRQSLDVLRKTEKLAAAARLAASMAHEINNPLEAVGNLIFLAKAAQGAPDAVIQSLNMAEQELARVAHLTRQTLGFYRESNQAELVDVPALVESVLSLYANKFKTRNIAVDCQFSPCPPLRCVPGEVKQVVANLVSNAADAVHNGGRIQLKTWCTDERDDKLFHLTIEDNGPGIPPQDRERIFEPFFTTKKDVGTGLGLWVTREIVTRHGGSIQVASKDGGASGAIFNVVLPCVADIPMTLAEHA